MSFREYINELNEAKAGRAWNGRLGKIDSLLAWMYDKDILNKGEKAKKDSIFRKYYRYYNDGDFPKGVKDENGETIYKGMNPDYVENALENQLDEFIKKILSKYFNKIDRGMFKIDTGIDKIETVIGVADDFDVHGLVTYWKKDVSDKNVLSLINNLEKSYSKLHSDMDKIDPNNSNMSMGYRINNMGAITPGVKSQWKDLKKQMIEISTLLMNIKTALVKLKKLKMLK